MEMVVKGAVKLKKTKDKGTLNAYELKANPGSSWAYVLHITYVWGKKKVLIKVIHNEFAWKCYPTSQKWAL